MNGFYMICWSLMAVGVFFMILGTVMTSQVTSNAQAECDKVDAFVVRTINGKFICVKGAI